MVSLSGSCRSRRRGPRAIFLPPTRAPGFLLVSCSKVSSLWLGTLLPLTTNDLRKCRPTQAKYHLEALSPLGGREALATRAAGPGTCQVRFVVSAQEHGSGLQQVRRPQRYRLGARLGRRPWFAHSGARDSIPNRSPDDLSQIGIVGFERQPWQNAGAQHRHRGLHRRAPLMLHVYRAPFSSPYSRDQLVTRPRTACHPGTRGFKVFLHGWEKLPLSKGFCTTCCRQSPLPPAHAALVPARADGATEMPPAESANGRRMVLPVSQLGRPVSLRVYAESNKRPHAHKLQVGADVAKATGHPDPWGLDPRILYDTSAALWKVSTGPWTAR